MECNGPLCKRSIIALTKKLLYQIEGDSSKREGLIDTPGRVARAYQEWFSGYRVNIPNLFKTFEEDGEDQIVVLRNVEFSSFCEHHMSPFLGHASIAYLPNKRVIGASKIGRLVQAYAQRLQIQERMGRQIADDIMQYLEPQGVVVVLKATHSCIKCRGLKSQDAEMVTSIVRGTFRKNHSSRMEAFTLIGST